MQTSKYEVEEENVKCIAIQLFGQGWLDWPLLMQRTDLLKQADN